jgi:hypothetical protein
VGAWGVWTYGRGIRAQGTKHQCPCGSVAVLERAPLDLGKQCRIGFQPVIFFPAPAAPKQPESCGLTFFTSFLDPLP